MRRAEPPPPCRVARAPTEWRLRGPLRPLGPAPARGNMDYLTTFTGKSGRLLRGTANRLWGFGGGGEARQVCFEDYLREPAQGDPGCGSPPHRLPAPSSPEGPGEHSLPSPPRGRPGLGWVLRGSARPWQAPDGAGRAGVARPRAGVLGRGGGAGREDSWPGRDALPSASQLFLLCSSCFFTSSRLSSPSRVFQGFDPFVFPSRREVDIKPIVTPVFLVSEIVSTAVPILGLGQCF